MHKNLLKVLLLGTVSIGVTFGACAGDDVPSVSIETSRLNLLDVSKIDFSNPVYIPGTGGTSVVNAPSITVQPGTAPAGGVGGTVQAPVSYVESSGATVAGPAAPVVDLGTVTVEAPLINDSVIRETATKAFAMTTETGSTLYAQGGRWVDESGKVLGDIKVGENTINLQGSDYSVQVASEAVKTALNQGVSLALANSAQAAANVAAKAFINSAVADALGNTFTQATANLAAKGVELTAGNLAKEAANILGDKAGKVVGDAVSKATEGAAKAATDAASKTMSGAAGEAAKEMGNKAASEAAEAAGKNVQDSINAAAAEWLVEAVVPYKVMQFNYAQYALLLWEAIKGQEIDDATKEVTVKGAEPMQESQGSQGGGASTASAASTAMAGTTIAGSANALISLLNMGKIDLSLLSTDIKKEEQKEVKKAVTASAGKSGADVDASAQASTQPEEETLTTDEQREIMHRRALLLGEWATAATQIGEGSNAISRAFYDRAKAFEAAANAAQGSLGGITAITDTDRFVLFEITRGAALSAVQLGLQGAANLNDLEKVATTTSDDTSAKPSVSVSGAKSQ